MSSSPLRPRTVLSPLHAENMSSALVQMTDHLAAQGILPGDLRETVVQSLEARERKLTTAIGNGLALPHASIPKLPGLISALGRVPEGFDAAAPDGQPVKILYLVLVPAEEYSLHLRTVAAVTRFFRSPGIYEKLHSAPDHALAGLFPA